MMRDVTLRVTALELAARWNEPRLALEQVDRLLGSAPSPDLAVLPEAAVTGYVSPDLDFDLGPFAEPLTGAMAASLTALARAHRCHLVAPLIERDGDRIYNTTLVLGPDGSTLARYRKRHPWYPEAWATPGDEPPPVLQVGGARVTLAVCFDVHFLAVDAAPQLREADVLVFPSAWVEDEDSRDSILPELARRFDVAVVNANWGVGSPRVPGQGRSRILDRHGEVLAMASGPGRIDARIDVP